MSIQLESVEEYRELREEQDRLYNESLEVDKAKVCTIDVLETTYRFILANCHRNLVLMFLRDKVYTHSHAGAVIDIFLCTILFFVQEELKQKQEELKQKKIAWNEVQK